MQADKYNPSLQSLEHLSPEPRTKDEKIRRTVTWYRVPLSALAVLALMMFIHQMQFFWYGVPVVILGELLQVWAASHLSKNKDFTVSGPYSHVRNPMYLGRFIMLLGFFIMTGNVSLMVAFVALFALYAQSRVAREELRLQIIFEPDYQHYCSHVSRWLPGLKPYERATSRRAKWSQVCLNNENLILFGVLALLVATYFRIQYLPHIYWSI